MVPGGWTLWQVVPGLQSVSEPPEESVKMLNLQSFPLQILPSQLGVQQESALLNKLPLEILK